MQSKQGYKSNAMHLIPQCIANWSGTGVSSNRFLSETMPFPWREEMEVKDSRSQSYMGFRSVLLIRTDRGEVSSGEILQLSTRLESWIFKNTHPSTSIKSEIWWATFQEIKATNKMASVPFSTLWEMANGQALLWWARRAANKWEEQRFKPPHSNSNTS